MKKTKIKSVKGSKKSVPAKPSRKPVDLAAVRAGITNLVGTKALSMVETTIEEVDKGHYAAMKYLFDLIGLYPENGEESPLGDDVLAKTLLRRLNLADNPKTDEAVTKGTETASQVALADAVE